MATRVGTSRDNAKPNRNIRDGREESRTLPKATPRRDLLNLAAMSASFGLGQGAIFIAQTMLVARGNLELLANFGTCFSFAVLATLTVDWGSGTIIARQVATPNVAAEPWSWSHYWSMTACRLIIAAVVILSFVLISMATSGPFLVGYSIGAGAGLLLWAFNFIGILDGIRLAGVSALTTVPPYLISGLALLVPMKDPGQSGLVLGAALSLGYAVSLVGQIVALRILGRPLRWHAPTWVHVRSAFGSGLGALGATMPGQLYFRVQLLLCALFLGTTGTAAFLYAKQTTTAVTQVFYFARRIQFPALIGRLRQPGPSLAWRALSYQKRAIQISILVSVALIAALLTVQAGWPNKVHGPFVLGVAVFAATIPTGVVALSYIQALSALALYGASGAVTVLSLTMATLLGCLTYLVRDIAVLAVADAAGHVLITLFSIRALTWFEAKR